MSSNKKRVAFHTLGCKLNFSETSTMARQFAELGYERVPSSAPADVYVINTCSVTEHADKKSRQAISKFKKLSPNAFIAVVGCYAQLKPNELAELEGVDLVLGTSEKANIPSYIGKHRPNVKAKVYSCEVDMLNDFFPAYSSADRTRSFLKVQDGCDYRCTYCTIPLARGKSRNIPIKQVVEQANEIAKLGVKEIVLTGVNTGDFGRTTGEKFIDLLTALEQVKGVERYRISSIEPNLITDEIINLTARSGKFLPHFHIPLQAGSNRILALMKRRYTREKFADRIQKIKELIPSAFIGVDIIVGFPGETDYDFLQSYTLMEELAPSFLHVFPYSERPGTPAIELPDKVKSVVKTERAAKLNQLSVHLHHNFNVSNVGATDEVLFESARKKELMYGFSRNYVKVEYPYSKELIGQIVRVKMTGISASGNMNVEIV